MSEYLIQGETLTNIADEIRTLSGTENLLGTTAMIERVSEANIEIADQANQIEEIMTMLEGKTYDSESLQPKVVIPTTDDQIITADEGYQALSVVTVKGDSNLVPENIAKDVSLFGVTGTCYKIDTCTVTISEDSTSYVQSYMFNVYEDGEIKTVSHIDAGVLDTLIELPVTVQNVVCSSGFSIRTEGASVETSTVTGTMRIVQMIGVDAFVQAPTAAGEHGVITLNPMNE